MPIIKLDIVFKQTAIVTNGAVRCTTQYEHNISFALCFDLPKKRYGLAMSTLLSPVWTRSLRIGFCFDPDRHGNVRAQLKQINVAVSACVKCFVYLSKHVMSIEYYANGAPLLIAIAILSA